VPPVTSVTSVNLSQPPDAVGSGPFDTATASTTPVHMDLSICCSTPTRPT
jgi:hypothetical protein